MSMNACLLLIVLLCSLGLIQGCQPDASADCKAFDALNANQQQAEFKHYPLEQQFEIFRCGVQREPPDIGLSVYIAAGGEKNVPFLLAKLRTEKSEAVQRYIIFVFEIMSRRGYLHGRQDVIDQSEEAISKMTIPFLKESSQESLKIIKESR
jgi:hypothetical protein